MSSLDRNIIHNTWCMWRKPFSAALGLLKVQVLESLETCLNRTLGGTENTVLIFHSSAVACKHKGWHNYVFDSHNRGSNGLCDPEGNWLIINSFKTCHFLRSLCQSLSATELWQYES